MAKWLYDELEQIVDLRAPGVAIWQHKTLSTLAHLMVCCLTAPSHYMKQWLLIFTGTFRKNFSGMWAKILIQEDLFENVCEKAAILPQHLC